MLCRRRRRIDRGEEERRETLSSHLISVQFSSVQITKVREDPIGA